MSQVYDEEEQVGGGMWVKNGLDCKKLRKAQCILKARIYGKDKKKVTKHDEHQLGDILYNVES